MEILKKLTSKSSPPKIVPKLEYRLNFDGCSKGNPGAAGAGAVLYHNDNEIWHGTFFVGEKSTNNEAEYAGLILGLIEANNQSIKTLLVQGDSMLVINHMKGVYKCKSHNLIEYYNEAKSLTKEFDYVEFEHVFRENNKRADELSNIALDSKI